VDNTWNTSADQRALYVTMQYFHDYCITVWMLFTTKWFTVEVSKLQTFSG